jgi:hypothetical protein
LLPDGAVAQGRQVRDHPDVPEEDRDRAVGRHREDVPLERRAEVLPDVVEFGSGKRNQAYQTRPTWKTGKMPAQTTAKIVIASAERLIEVRHFWRRRHRMAEISVPAWPMPIQKTKLTMSQAQLTGLRWPQTPTPVETR